MSDANRHPDADLDLLRAELDACRVEIARLRARLRFWQGECERADRDHWQQVETARKEAFA